MKELGELVRIARENRRWTQTDLGGRLGYTHSFVVRIERGTITHLPEPEVMRKLEQELGIPRVTMLQAAGYLDVAGSQDAAICVQAEDSRAHLLKLLDFSTDAEVRKATLLVAVLLDREGGE